MKKYCFSILILSLYFFITFPLVAQQLVWDKVEGPFGGTARAITITAKGTLLAGMANGVVYRSTDQGTTWHKTGSFNSDVRCFVHTKSHGIFVAGDRGYIYSSTDDGVSWNSIFGFIPTLGVYSLAVNDLGLMFAGTPDGYYRSKDFGANWAKDTTIKTVVIETIIYPNDSVYVFSHSGSYLSSDKGLTWKKISTTVGNCFTKGDSGKYFTLSGGKLVCSKDYGRSWNEIFSYAFPESYALHCDSLGTLYIGSYRKGLFQLKNDTLSTVGLEENTAFSIVSSSPSTLYAATNQGAVYFSSDSGSTWTRRNNGITAVTVWCFSNLFSSIVYSGAYQDGVYRSTNNGNTWSFVGFEGKKIWAIQGSGDSTIFALSDAGLFRSTDAGKTWLYNRDAVSSYNCLTSNKKGIVFVTTQTGVARTTDGGNTWSDLPGVTSRYVHCNSEDRLFAYGSLGVQYSVDNGETWTKRNFPQQVINLHSFAALGNDLIVGTAGNGLMRSTNLGSSWMSTAFSNSNVNAVVIANERRYFAATQFSGVNEFDTLTKEWKQVGLSLPSQWVWTMTMNSLGQLVASLEGQGISKTVSPVTSVQQDRIVQPSGFVLSQNYPNPFNPSTTIRYALSPNPSPAGRGDGVRVKLTIHDILGREIATLVNEEQSAGWKEVQWNADSFANGVYIYRLTVGTFAEMKKMVLLK